MGLVVVDCFKKGWVLVVECRAMGKGVDIRDWDANRVSLDHMVMDLGYQEYFVVAYFNAKCIENIFGIT